MITEFMLAGALLKGYDVVKNRDSYTIKTKFNRLMQEKKLGYKAIEAVKTDYGYKLIASILNQGFDKLKSCEDILKTCYGHNIEIQQNDNLKTATIYIIINSITNTTKFEPIKTKPYEIYIGLSNKRQKLISNLNKFPHVLVSGQTGSGKTEIIRAIVANHIYNHSDRDINIYFSDMSAMCDFDIFIDCKQVKGYARTIEESEQLFNYLIHLYEKRLSIFAKHKVKNIVEYNNLNYNKRMSYIDLVLDEFADYFPTSKLEDSYDLKVKCYNIIKHMVRKFRKVGINLIIGIQRPDTTVLDASLRSGLCTKIGFSQNTDSSSLVVCDTTELTNIENRKALLMYGNTREWFKSLYIDDELIKHYIKDSIMNNKTDFNKFLNQTNNSPKSIETHKTPATKEAAVSNLIDMKLKNTSIKHKVKIK